MTPNVSPQCIRTHTITLQTHFTVRSQQSPRNFDTTQNVRREDDRQKKTRPTWQWAGCKSWETKQHAKRSERTMTKRNQMDVPHFPQRSSPEQASSTCKTPTCKTRRKIITQTTKNCTNERERETTKTKESVDTKPRLAALGQWRRSGTRDNPKKSEKAAQLQAEMQPELATLRNENDVKWTALRHRQTNCLASHTESETIQMIRQTSRANEGIETRNKKQRTMCANC